MAVICSRNCHGPLGQSEHCPFHTACRSLSIQSSRWPYDHITKHRHQLRVELSVLNGYVIDPIIVAMIT